ncbi:transcription initiation factor TFIID subunit 5-like [Anneissia japonica]|uniref:transcription initiation factor TFIID subunit 5-like n=1 Tax=Anneissia japonica TaxID=1529436 RepID=UPI0014258F83|nr:transcription initiation factor TFIID subunit 5-like [Anneissia japonica]
MAEAEDSKENILKNGEDNEQQKQMDRNTLAAVLQFLQKNNLKETAALLKKEADVQEKDVRTTASNDQDVSSVLSAYTNESDPTFYHEHYNNLMQFIENSLDVQKSELSQMLYPVFVHMYLELVYNDHEQKAKHFFDEFSKEQEEYHQEDITKLSVVTKKDHMTKNELMVCFRTSKYVIRLSRDSYQSLRRYLKDKQNSTVLTILEDHLYVDVFDGMPRNKEQISAKAGGMVGEARRDANKAKVFYGLLKEPDINLQLDDEEESGEGDDKPKKKKPKKDSLSSKKNKPDPNAPPNTRVPLPELKDSDKLARAIALRESAKRIRLAADSLPSICFYSFLNAYDGLISADISDDSSMMTCGFADSCVRVWSVTPKKLRNMKPLKQLDAIDKEADDVLERIMDERTASESKTMLGHSGPVYSTCFSPDKSFVLSSSEDATVRLWSTYTYTNLVCYKGHNYPVWDCCFGPYGHYFASAGHDRVARLWATEYHQPLRILAGHFSDVDSIRFHPNSNYVVTGSSDRTIRLWDVTDGKCVRILTGHKGSILSLAFSPDGHYLASAGTDKRVLIWEMRHGYLLGELKGHTDAIYTVSFSRDGNILASGGSDNCVKLWDAQKVLKEAASEDIAGSQPPIISNIDETLLGSYPTKTTSVHHVHFTRRNLLLAAGPYAASS